MCITSPPKYDIPFLFFMCFSSVVSVSSGVQVHLLDAICATCSIQTIVVECTYFSNFNGIMSRRMTLYLKGRLYFHGLLAYEQAFIWYLTTQAKRLTCKVPCIKKIKRETNILILRNICRVALQLLRNNFMRPLRLRTLLHCSTPAPIQLGIRTIRQPRGPNRWLLPRNPSL